MSKYLGNLRYQIVFHLRTATPGSKDSFSCHVQLALLTCQWHMAWLKFMTVCLSSWSYLPKYIGLVDISLVKKAVMWQSSPDHSASSCESWEPGSTLFSQQTNERCSTSWETCLKTYVYNKPVLPHSPINAFIVRSLPRKYNTYTCIIQSWSL